MKPRISQLAKTTHGQQTARAPRARQDYKVATLGKSAKCVALFLESIKMLQPKTWSRYNTIILVYICVPKSQRIIAILIFFGTDTKPLLRRSIYQASFSEMLSFITI